MSKTFPLERPVTTRMFKQKRRRLNRTHHQESVSPSLIWELSRVDLRPLRSTFFMGFNIY